MGSRRFGSQVLSRFARTPVLVAMGVVAGALLGAFARDLAQAPTAEAQSDKTPGKAKSTTTRVLTAGSNLLQDFTPVKAIGLHVVGLHPDRDNPSHQMIAHHYCEQVNEEFAQCALYDGDGKGARLNGVEYIIAARLFETLPEDEKSYWHPHNYEILSGQLVAPRLPAAAEKEALERKMNSYGKTWHVWHTGVPGQAGDALPLGPARLAWSFNHDGEARQGVLEAHEQRLGVSLAAKRKEREGLRALAKPQKGEDLLKAKLLPKAR